MEKVKKYFQVLKLLIGLDWSVVEELELLSQRVYAVESLVKMDRVSLNRLNLSFLDHVKKEKYDD